MTLTIDQQRAALLAEMERQGVTQHELARRIGRTDKHVSQVLTGKAGTAELDYWAFVLGLRFVVSLAPIEGGA